MTVLWFDRVDALDADRVTERLTDGYEQTGGAETFNGERWAVLLVLEPTPFPACQTCGEEVDAVGDLECHGCKRQDADDQRDDERERAYERFKDERGM